MVFRIEAPPLVYRHVVVKRKSSSQLVADPETLRKAFNQYKEVLAGDRDQVDPDLMGLLRRDFLRKTTKGVLGDEETAKTASSDQGYGIVVATLHKEKIPGGEEPLPQHAVFVSLKAPSEEKDPYAAFLQTAEELQRRFREASDRQIQNLPQEMQADVTLVTVVYSPISAFALDGRFHERGFEVGMEYIQKTRFGRVGTSTFEVCSEEGIYPISPPSKEYMATLTKSVEELGAYDRGFLTEEQRERIAQETAANRSRRAFGSSSGEVK